MEETFEEFKNKMQGWRDGGLIVTEDYVGRGRRKEPRFKTDIPIKVELHRVGENHEDTNTTTRHDLTDNNRSLRD